MASVPEATPQARPLRYGSVAVALHWLTALLIVRQIWIGWTFHDMPRTDPLRAEIFTVHKTLGVVILLLALLRLGWRIAHPPPPYPEDMPGWERWVGTINHSAFYALIIGLPLTGLAAVGGRGDATTVLLGGLPFPTLAFLGADASKALGGLHEPLIFLTLVLLALHVAAALKHQFVDRTKASGRMWPFKARA